MNFQQLNDPDQIKILQAQLSNLNPHYKANRLNNFFNHFYHQKQFQKLISFSLYTNHQLILFYCMLTLQYIFKDKKTLLTPSQINKISQFIFKIGEQKQNLMGIINFNQWISMSAKFMYRHLSMNGMKEIIELFYQTAQKSIYQHYFALNLLINVIDQFELSNLSKKECKFKENISSEILKFAFVSLEQIIIEENSQEEMILIIIQALKLIHACFNYDFLGNKRKQKWDYFLEEKSPIIIPSKSRLTRNIDLSEFQKLKSTQFFRMLIACLQKFEDKNVYLQIIKILGNMCRIKLKFFKTINNYHIFLQNIVILLNKICQQSQCWGNQIIPQLIYTMPKTILNFSLEFFFSSQILVQWINKAIDIFNAFMLNQKLEQNIVYPLLDFMSHIMKYQKGFQIEYSYNYDKIRNRILQSIVQYMNWLVQCKHQRIFREYKTFSLYVLGVDHIYFNYIESFSNILYIQVQNHQKIKNSYYYQYSLYVQRIIRSIFLNGWFIIKSLQKQIQLLNKNLSNSNSEIMQHLKKELINYFSNRQQLHLYELPYSQHLLYCQMIYIHNRQLFKLFKIGKSFFQILRFIKQPQQIITILYRSNFYLIKHMNDTFKLQKLVRFNQHTDLNFLIQQLIYFEPPKLKYIASLICNRLFSQSDQQFLLFSNFLQKANARTSFDLSIGIIKSLGQFTKEPDLQLSLVLLVKKQIQKFHPILTQNDNKQYFCHILLFVIKTQSQHFKKKKQLQTLQFLFYQYMLTLEEIPFTTHVHFYEVSMLYQICKYLIGISNYLKIDKGENQKLMNFQKIIREIIFSVDQDILQLIKMYIYNFWPIDSEIYARVLSLLLMRMKNTGLENFDQIGQMVFLLNQLNLIIRNIKIDQIISLKLYPIIESLLEQLLTQNFVYCWGLLKTIWEIQKNLFTNVFGQFVASVSIPLKSKLMDFVNKILSAQEQTVRQNVQVWHIEIENLINN